MLARRPAEGPQAIPSEPLDRPFIWGGAAILAVVAIMWIALLAAVLGSYQEGDGMLRRTEPELSTPQTAPAGGGSPLPIATPPSGEAADDAGE